MQSTEVRQSVFNHVLKILKLTVTFTFHRSILFCTKSLIELAKCSWLQEVALVYGVEPNIQCMRADTQDSCLKNVQHNVSDVVIVDQDTRLRAEREYKLKPILYEYSSTLEDKYVVVAVIRAASNFKSGFGT